MARRGLTVAADGRLLLDGSRFRNIGLNYGGAVQRIYSQVSPTACAYTPSAEQDQALDIAAQCGAKVLRVKATPFWPAQWIYGLNGGKAWSAATAADREPHYQRIDAFLDKCQARGIGVILTLFFRHASVPDLVGEPVRAWLTAGSNTRNVAAAITQEVVTRYLNHDAVYGYEWSNEVNHYNDASDATRGGFPAVNAGFGTASSYSAATAMFNGAEFASVLSWWYGVVKSIDNQRLVMSGNGPNSYSRPGGTAGIVQPISAWYDEQLRDNPMNSVSIHWYGNVSYGSNGFRALESILAGGRHRAAQRGQAFVVGEFGNQPWRVDAVAVSGGAATLQVAQAIPVDVGDDIDLRGTTRFDGNYVVTSLNGARTVLTAQAPNAVADGAWSGVASARHMTSRKLDRVCADIARADVDLALLWGLDLDPLCPVHESISEPGAEAQVRVLAAANAARNTP